MLFSWVTLVSCSRGPDERPHVLIIVADDLSSKAVTGFGGPSGLTPNLARLGGEGVSFQRAVVSTPLCTPSRQSLLTGQYPHTIGVTQLATPLRAGTKTMAHAFRDAGYRTAAIGKMHWHARPGPSEARHGFDVVVDLPEWRETLTREERTAFAEHRAMASEKDERGWGAYNLEREPVALAPERTSTAYFVDRTLALFDDAKREPVFVFCGLYEPHAPFVFPESFAERVRPEDVTLPSADERDPARLRREVPGLWVRRRDREKRFGPLSDDVLRNMSAAYQCSTAWLDSEVGRLLDGLEARGLHENTLVVFWSDHGFFLGEHGLTGKNFPFREALEVPLIVRGPGLEPGRVERPVEAVDLFPTLCERTGVARPSGLPGQDLFDPADPARPAFAALAGSWACLVTEDAKLVLGIEPSRGLDQLYDLRADPGERVNLLSQGAEVPNGLVEEMIDRYVETAPPGASEAWSPPQEDRGLSTLRALVAEIQPRRGRSGR